MKSITDPRDIESLNARQEAFDSRKGPRVGDFVEMKDGSLERFSHDWGKSIQTTDGKFGASFYMSRSGLADFSGGLNPSIPKDKLTLTGEKEGCFWFFHHEVAMAHNGVVAQLMCRTYRYNQ